MNKINKTLILFLCSILLLNILPLNSVAANKPLLSFAIMSDTHVLSDSDSCSYYNRLRNGLLDTATYSNKPDAVVIAGDLTDGGYEYQYKRFVKALGSSPTSNILTVMGNHDAGRHQTGGYTEAFARYKKYCGTYGCGTNSSVPYYDRWINGYHFIVISTEAALKDQAYISNTQLNWLETKLAEKAEPEKPIFVISHQAIKGTHGRTEKDEENLGAQNDQVKALIEKYPQVIFMSGHTHNGFGYTNSYVNNGKCSYVHIPPTKGAPYGYTSGSVLYFVEVYNGKVVFRARDFGTKQWLTQYDITIKFPEKITPKPTQAPTPSPTPVPKTLESISINTMPTKTKYAVGKPFSTLGLSINLVYSDESVDTISSDFEISGFESETAGTKTLTISYLDYTTTFDIEVKEPSGIPYGDADSNGSINAMDAMIALQHSVELISDDAINLTLADVDGNSIVDSVDAMLILQFDVEIIDFFPVEE
ncbi:MAG: hypothetical protein E7388_03495 [Ruminococcaceae bacterium]|nr:hypothetical protein [Oscillospiraceae bacterium]